jgi:DNA-binding NarL/FixJ family response regulator
MSALDASKQTPPESNERPAVAIVDSHLLTRTCLATLLRAELDVDVTGVASTSEASETLGPNTRIIVVNAEARSLADPDLVRDVSRLAETFPQAAIALLTQSDGDLPAEAIREPIGGVFPTLTTSIDLMLAGIRLMLAGGAYLPRQIALSRSIESVAEQEASAILSPAVIPKQPFKARRAALRYRSGRDGSEDLTPREEEVLVEVQCGHPNKVIAARLRMSENTVKMHIRHIMRKLGTRNRTETVFLWLRRNRLADSPSPLIEIDRPA